MRVTDPKVSSTTVQEVDGAKGQKNEGEGAKGSSAGWRRRFGHQKRGQQRQVHHCRMLTVPKSTAMMETEPRSAAQEGCGTYGY